MDLALQTWGCVSYTLNKIGLAAAHGVHRWRWARLGWWMFLVGIPPWTIILCLRGDWMVAALECGSIPAVLLGLVGAYREQEKADRRWQRSVDVFTYTMLALGVSYSLYSNHGLASTSQLLELGSIAGYLIGANLLAQSRRSGWIWFMLMNLSMGALMALQHKPILAVQQAASLGFDIRGLVTWKGDHHTG